MTIVNTANKVTVTCDGVVSVFDYDFEIPTGSGFVLVQTVTATGDQTIISTANYSVSGIGNEAGGTFTYLPAGSPVASGNTLTFLRQLPNTQQTSLGDQGNVYPAAVEGGLDWIVMQIQDLQEKVDRCFRIPVVDNNPSGGAQNVLVPAAQRANLALLFDTDGNPYAG